MDLLPFLREFVAAEPRIAAISIHDYKGRAQVTVGSGRLLEDEIQPLIEGVITGEKSISTDLRSTAGGTRLLIAAPIVFTPTRSVEGALSVEIDLPALFGRYSAEAPEHHRGR